MRLELILTRSHEWSYQLDELLKSKSRLIKYAYQDFFFFIKKLLVWNTRIELVPLTPKVSVLPLY